MKNIFIATVIFIFISCNPKEKLFEVQSGEADFSNTVVLGGGYFCGYTSGGVNNIAFNRSLSFMIAEQLKLAGGNSIEYAKFETAEGIGYNLKPWEYRFHTQSKMDNRTDCKGIVSVGPVKNEAGANSISEFALINANTTCIAVPYATTAEILDNQFVNSNKLGSDFFKKISSTNSHSMLDEAKKRNPTFFIAWPGFEDVLNYAIFGGAKYELPSASEFENNLNTILNELISPRNAKGVIATIPDVSTFPFFNTIKWNNAELNQIQADSLNDIYTISGLNHINFIEGKNGFIINDATQASGFRQMVDGELITLTVPLDSMKCFKYGLIVNVVKNSYVLDRNELLKMRNVINQFNEIIKSKATQYNIAVAETDVFFKKLSNGIKYDGADFTTAFISGNFFSLDGLYPTEKGYELLANDFIKAINQKYKSTIPLHHCNECEFNRLK